MKRVLRQIFFLPLLLSIFVPVLFSQSPKRLYEEACLSIDSMLSGTASLDFKKAVFLTESAYLENQLDMEEWNERLQFYAAVCRGIVSSGNIIYHESDFENAAAQCAVFRFMMDSIPLYSETGEVWHLPFEYNYEDYTGDEEWSNVFVNTLMRTHRGNCHSLTYLYKLIMSELGQPAFLSLAPDHIYIKVWNKRTGWYNMELTCGDFPTDAWVMSSGYIHTDAVRSGIYMDTLSLKQSVAFCLLDLAQGYHAKFGMEDGRFMLRCCETALEHYPDCIYALLLKAEISTALLQQILGKDAEEHARSNMSLTALYSKIHRLGYRKMPEDMYLKWLQSMEEKLINYRAKALLMKGE